MSGDKPIFDLFDAAESAGSAKAEILKRFSAPDNTGFERDALRFAASEDLKSAINVSLATRRPLLLTGEPGTGKTLTAYHIAQTFSLGEVLHFQVKSDSKHTDLLYFFDAVAYLREAYRASAQPGEQRATPLSPVPVDRAQFVERRPLWEAYESPEPRVLLIDEIDKAPRDFPNDLLLELDRHMFTVRETSERIRARTLPIVVITSNSERYLPDAFLRRCVFHHMALTKELLTSAVEAHRADYQGLSNGVINLAVDRVMELRELGLLRPPATAELLLWLTVLCHAESTEDKARDAIKQLRHLGALVKTADDILVVSRELQTASINPST